MTDIGFWQMPCWNGLHPWQQAHLIIVGNLPINYRPNGWCPNPADLCIETRWDEAPGPRFYCLRCGTVELVNTLNKMHYPYTTKENPMLSEEEVKEKLTTLTGQVQAIVDKANEAIQNHDRGDLASGLLSDIRDGAQQALDNIKTATAEPQGEPVPDTGGGATPQQGEQAGQG